MGMEPLRGEPMCVDGLEHECMMDGPHWEPLCVGGPEHEDAREDPPDQCLPFV